MTLFYLLYYICICTIITFYECNYVKRAWKEMSFQIKCVIMKLTFYHLVLYVDELQISVEEIIVDIMDVKTDNWVAVTCKNNWFLGVAFNVQSFNSSHCILSVTLVTYLMLERLKDPSLKLVRKGEWRMGPSCEGWEKKRVELRLGEGYVTCLSV